MKKVLLYGIGGAYNYGCEAIVRGTVELLKSQSPELEIFCASLRPEDDRKRLADCPVTVVPRRLFRRYSAQRVLRKLAQKVGVPFYPCIDDPSQADGMDAVISIGGDIYTLSPSGRMDSLLFRFGEEVQKRGIPYVIWGASIGPFSSNAAAERRICKHLHSTTLIYAREEITIAYLRNLGIHSNVEFFPDPAFFVKDRNLANKTQNRSRLRFAINLSPLSAIYCGLPLGQTIIEHAKTIDNLINQFNAEVVLVPHVVDKINAGDDDLRYLRQVAENIKNQERITLIDTDPGFLGIRRTLVDCDLVIAARMHCAINAITAYVPTVLLAYSQKSKGMAEFIYGNRTQIIDLKEFNARSVNPLIRRIIDNKDTINKSLTARLTYINNFNGKHLSWTK